MAANKTGPSSALITSLEARSAIDVVSFPRRFSACRMEESADRSRPFLSPPVFHDGRIHAAFVSSAWPVNAPRIGVTSPRALSAHQSRLSPLSRSSFPLYWREMLGYSVYEDVEVRELDPP